MFYKLCQGGQNMKYIYTLDKGSICFQVFKAPLDRERVQTRV